MNLDAAIRAHAVDVADPTWIAGVDADAPLVWRWLAWLSTTHTIGEAVTIVVVAGASMAGLVKLFAIARQTWIAKTNTPAHGVGGVKYGRVTSVSRPVFQPADPHHGLRRAAVSAATFSGASTPRRGLNEAIGSTPAAASALRTPHGSDSLARKSASVAFADDVDARARRAVEGTAAMPPLPVAPSSSLLAASQRGSNPATPRSMTSTELQHYQSSGHDVSAYGGGSDASMLRPPPPQMVFAPVELGAGGRTSRRSSSAAKRATHRRRQGKSHEAADDRGAGKKHHASSAATPKPSAAFVAEPSRQRAGGRPSSSLDCDDFAMPPPAAAAAAAADLGVPPDVEPIDESTATIDLLPVPAGRRHRKDAGDGDAASPGSRGALPTTTSKHTPRRGRHSDADAAEEALYREPWAVALGVAGPPRQTHRREPVHDGASAAAAAGSDASDGDGSLSGTPKMGASSVNDSSSGLGIFVGPGSKRPAEAPSAPIRFDFDKYHVSLGELVVRPPTPPPPPPPAPAAAAPSQAKAPAAPTAQDPKAPATSTAFGPSKRAVAAPSKESGSSQAAPPVSGPFGNGAASKKDAESPTQQQETPAASKPTPFGRKVTAPASADVKNGHEASTAGDAADAADGRQTTAPKNDVTTAEDVAAKPSSKDAGSDQQQAAVTKPAGFPAPGGASKPSSFGSMAKLLDNGGGSDVKKDARTPAATGGATGPFGSSMAKPADAPGTPGDKPAGSKGLGAMGVAFNSPRKPPAMPKAPDSGSGWGKPKATAAVADTAAVAAPPASAPTASSDQQKAAPSAPSGFGEGPKKAASPWGQAPPKTPPPAAGSKGFGAAAAAAAVPPASSAASPWGSAQPAAAAAASGFSSGPKAPPSAGGKPPLAPAAAPAARGRYDNDDDAVVPAPPPSGGASSAFGAPKQPQQAPSGAFGSAPPAAAAGGKSGGMFAGVAPSKGPPPAYTPGAPGSGAFGMTSAVQPASKAPVLVPSSSGGAVGGGGSGAFGSKAPMTPGNGSFGTSASNSWGSAPAGTSAPPRSSAPVGGTRSRPQGGRGGRGGGASRSGAGRRSY